jgi:hypothetical protein
MQFRKGLVFGIRKRFRLLQKGIQPDFEDVGEFI